MVYVYVEHLYPNKVHLLYCLILCIASLDPIMKWSNIVCKVNQVCKVCSVVPTRIAHPRNEAHILCGVV